jgi:asparagine synthase (glutamine-hydrolysing)
VAATARDLQQRGATTTGLHAFTFDSAGLFPADDELRYAALAATRLGLTQRTFNMREYVLFRERSGALVRPGVEPANAMLAAAWTDSVREVARVGRVMLTGHGGDGILASSQLHVLRMLRRGRWLRVARECGEYWLRRHKVPPMGIRSRVKQRLGLVPPAPAFPAWIEPELARRLRLHEKWNARHQPSAVAGDDLRAEAARHMRTSWATILDAYDAEWSRSAVEYRHPFFDLRVVDFLLQVPPLPWLASKELARDAWPNLLPEVVRNRPKVPLRGDHLRARVERGDEAPVEWCCPEIGHFICSNSAPAFQSCVGAPVSLYLVAHTVSLGLWLRGFHKKDDHEYSQSRYQRTACGFAPELQHSASD